MTLFKEVKRLATDEHGKEGPQKTQNTRRKEENKNICVVLWNLSKVEVRRCVK
jgi:hypothetical protein